jgi:hypothetical protein
MSHLFSVSARSHSLSNIGSCLLPGQKATSSMGTYDRVIIQGTGPDGHRAGMFSQGFDIVRKGLSQEARKGRSRPTAAVADVVKAR